jgi:hypothetical protein
VYDGVVVKRIHTHTHTNNTVMFKACLFSPRFRGRFWLNMD